MHLLEAVLALFEASGDPRWLAEAESLVTLFRERFFDRETGTLGEFFAADWTPDAANGHIVEPGHHFEWVWLLYRYAALSGRLVDPAAEGLFAVAMRHGFDAAHGGILDQHDRAGRPLLRSRRIWTIAEAIKAQVARIEAGLSVPPDHPGALIDQLCRDFLNPARLGWIETITADGQPDLTDLPGSTPYHLFLASAEVARVMPAR
jgi:mannose-6-phosphate isomerase